MQQEDQMIHELIDALENVTAALRNVCAAHNQPMSVPDLIARRATIREAEAVLAKARGMDRIDEIDPKHELRNPE